ncbi:MAG: DUF4340 domain-containing protein [Phycisphaerales bacterium]
MSNKAIIIAVLLALGLLSLILYSNWRSTSSGGAATAPGVTNAPTRDGAALPINAAEVINIKVAFKGTEDAVTRDAVGDGAGGWAFVFPKPATTTIASTATPAEQLTWPADPAQVETLLRALAELKPAPSAGKAGKLPADAALITLTMKDGSTRLVRISPTPIAGSTAVDIDGKSPFMTDASILAAATQPGGGPRGWRINRALPGAAAAELSRVSMTTPTETLAFSRQENRWFISRPVSARAGAAGVGTLLDSLSRIEIDRFITDPAQTTTTAGLASPRMIITTERDLRSLDAQGNLQTDTRRRSLFIGGPADPAGNTLFASSDPTGVPLFTVPAAAINALSTSAKGYLDVTASSASPSDVGLITIKAGKNETAFRRVNGKWHKLLPGGKTDKAEVDSKKIAEMVDFFTQRQGQADLFATTAPSPATTPSSATSPSPTPSGAGKSAKPTASSGGGATKVAGATGAPTPVSSLARISLMTDDGTEIDTLTMGYTPEGTLAAKAQDVILTYTGATAPKLLSLPAHKPGPGQPQKKTAKPPTGTSKK